MSIEEVLAALPGEYAAWEPRGSRGGKRARAGRPSLDWFAYLGNRSLHEVGFRYVIERAAHGPQRLEKPSSQGFFDRLVPPIEIDLADRPSAKDASKREKFALKKRHAAFQHAVKNPSKSELKHNADYRAARRALRSDA